MDWTDMIEINGLTGDQCLMLDVIWSFQTKVEYLTWYDLLDPADQDMANGLLHLLALAIVEEQDDGSLAEANAVLSKFRLNKE